MSHNSASTTFSVIAFLPPYSFLQLYRNNPVLSSLFFLFFFFNCTVMVAGATPLEEAAIEISYQQDFSNTSKKNNGYDFQLLDSRFFWLDSNEILYKKDFFFNSNTANVTSLLPSSSTFMPGEYKIKFLLNSKFTFPPPSPFKSHTTSNLLFDKQLSSTWEFNSSQFMDNREATSFSLLSYDQGTGFNTILPPLITRTEESDYTQPPLMERMKNIIHVIIPLIIIIAFLSHNLRLQTTLLLLIVWFVGFELFKLLQFLMQISVN